MGFFDRLKRHVREVEEKTLTEIKVYPGPKKPFKKSITLLLILSLMLGFSLIKPRISPTGYVISSNISVNLLGLVLVAIPLILVLFWIKKRY